MLHGRQRECTLIEELLAAAGERRSGVLVVRGEAGIGKSALLGYAAERAGDMRVLRGTGVESESEFPFAAVHQLLRPVAGLFDAIPERLGAALRGAFGLGPAGGEDSSQGGDRFLISLAVLSVLAEAAEEGPLLCLIDDAHWLDGASAGALSFAARRLDAEGVVMLFATREEVPGLPDLTLSGLDPPAAGALLAERCHVDLPAAVRDSLVASTAGNPLGLLELPGSLSADQLAGREPLPERLPVGAEVEQVFLERVRRQDQPTQTLLLLAAAEDSGELDVLLRAARSLGVDESALDIAEKAGLIRITGRTVAFCHPLVRTAVYRGATFWQRRDARNALAEALDGDADRRAWHLAAAALGPDETVAAELHRSAERARQRGGHAAAASAYERSAVLTAEAGRRGERFTDAAEAAWQAGLPGRAATLLDRAATLVATPPARGRLEHLRGSIEGSSGELTSAFAILVGAAEPLARLDPVRAARMLTEAGQAAWLAGDVAGLHEVARRLADLPVPDAAVPLSAQLVLGLDSLLSGDLTTAVPHLRDAAARAAHGADPRAMMLSAAGATFLGDDAVAIGLFTTAIAGARSAGAVAMIPPLLAPLSSLQAWTGRYSAASASAAEGLRVAVETGQEHPAAHLRSVCAWVAAVQGQEEQCLAYAEKAHAHAMSHRIGPAAGIASWALALLDLGAGRPESAADRLEALATAGPGESHPVVRVFSAADLVEAAVRTGRRDTAERARDRLRSWTEATGSAWGRALLHRCHGLLADPSGADRHFTAALAAHRLGGRPFDTARTALLYGEILRRRRRRNDARVHLRAAHETFDRLGVPGWAELARTELRATGETARRRDPGTLRQLTPQEVLIVQIVGEGATNREVAAQLFLSPRTVDYHLRKVFTKLDVSSRADLIRLVAQSDR
ncbi:AAA family ATPase [Actinoplanes sp. NPDC051861]|uniref:ATP-binding protein n=1 Tax=Actinoplanes sp. NPDC051861 TaxID=3155170 RepID=UPI003413B441